MDNYSPIIIAGVLTLVTTLLNTWYQHRLEKPKNQDIQNNKFGNWDRFWGFLSIMSSLILSGGLSYYAIDTVFDEKLDFPDGLALLFLVAIVSILFSLIYIFPALYIAFQPLNDNDNLLRGIFSVSTFSGLFTKLVGKTPSDYANQHRDRKTKIENTPFAFVPSCYSYMLGWTKNSNFEDENK